MNLQTILASIESRFDEKFGGTLETVHANSGVIKNFIRQSHEEIIQAVVEEIEKLNDIDHEAKGYEILDKWEGEVCCMADAVGGGYGEALDDLKEALLSPKKS